MKPHIRFYKGRWRIWRDRSTCPWQFPVTVRDSFEDAVKAYNKYIRS